LVGRGVGEGALITAGPPAAATRAERVDARNRSTSAHSTPSTSSGVGVAVGATVGVGCGDAVGATATEDSAGGVDPPTHDTTRVAASSVKRARTPVDARGAIEGVDSKMSQPPVRR
jgi:hypothetical protein